MTTSLSPASLSLYNHDANGEPLPTGPIYPSVLPNGYFVGRRTISSPPLPSTRLVPLPGKTMHDGRSPIQRFGHRTIEQADAHILNDLIALHTAELSSLDMQLSETERLLVMANKRAADVTGLHEEFSAQAVRDSVMQTRRSTLERIKEVKRLTQSFRGLVHPVRKLPVELLTMIMQFSVEQEESDRRNALFLPDPPRRPRSPPIRINTLDEASNPNESPSTRQFPSQPLPTAILLSQVCSFWRATAHKTPALWRTIHFRLSGQPDVGLHSWSMVRWFMEKAKHDPTALEQSSRMGLVFTGWVEHEHPSPNSSLQKILRMLAENEGGKAPGETTIYVSEAPGHSRRYSDAPSTIELSLTPDSESEDAPGDSIVVPGMPVLEGPAPQAPPTFRLGRLEIDFHTLCEHDLLAGQSSNSQLHWSSSSPKPEQVVFIAQDSVYGAPPHGHGPTVGLLSPPYSKSLIPSAKEVTLCNLSFDWSVNPRSGDSYSKLTTLKLIYTRHFDRLLQKPENMDNMGFLQFLRVAHNLVDLEIRLASPPTVSAVPVEVTPLALAAVQANGMPPISIPISLQRLTISLPDLCRIIPLFLPESARPSAPTTHLSSLTHLSILPSYPRGQSEPSSMEGNAQLIDQFLHTTEAMINHLEFLPPNSSEFATQDLLSSTLTVHPPRASFHAKEQMMFLMQQFHNCDTIEAWGDDNAKGLIACLGVAPAPTIAVVHEADTPSISHPSVRTSSSLRPGETAVSRVQSEALRNHLGNHQLSSAPQSNGTTDSLSSPTEKSTKKLTKASKKGSLIPKPQKRNSVLSTPRDIIAKVLAPFSRRHSLALVESPVGTPTMIVQDLPTEPPVDFAEMHDPGLLAAPNPSSVRSSSSHFDARMHTQSRVASSSSRADASSALASGDEGFASTSQDAHFGFVGDDVHVFPSVKKVIIHDAVSFTPPVVKALTARGIDVVVYG